jgi:hypothetical protein
METIDNMNVTIRPGLAPPVAEALSVPMRAIVQPTFLLEPREGADAIEVSLAAVAQGTSAICTYSSNASAKRAAQRMIPGVGPR